MSEMRLILMVMLIVLILTGGIFHDRVLFCLEAFIFAGYLYGEGVLLKQAVSGDEKVRRRAIGQIKCIAFAVMSVAVVTLSQR